MVLDTNPTYTAARLGVRRLGKLPVNNRAVGQPMRWLTQSGLAGLARLGQDEYQKIDYQKPDEGGYPIRRPMTDLIDVPPGTPGESPAPSSGSFWDNIPTIMPAVNAEIGWLTNLVRASTGRAPLPMSVAAPAVNVGLSAETRKMVIYGGVGLGALLLVRFLKKK